MKIEDNYIELLTKPYSNFFCQQLFFRLDVNLRKCVLRMIINSLSFLIRSSNGQCSVTFIFENLHLQKEQIFIFSMLQSSLYEIIWKSKFMRVAESLIGTFNFELVSPLVEYIIFHIKLFIRPREGYFLLRSIIKCTKILESQIFIIQSLRSNFTEILKSPNGPLLVQCIIHNFPVAHFSYTKSCTQILDQEDNDSSDSKRNEKQKFNPALQMLYQTLIQNIGDWDKKCLKPIIECCIRIGGTQFEMLFLIEMQNSSYLNTFLTSSFGTRYFNLIINRFKHKSIRLIYSLIRSSLCLIDNNSQLRWTNFMLSNNRQNEFVNAKSIKPIKLTNDESLFFNETAYNSVQQVNLNNGLTTYRYCNINPLGYNCFALSTVNNYSYSLTPKNCQTICHRPTFKPQLTKETALERVYNSHSLTNELYKEGSTLKLSYEGNLNSSNIRSFGNSANFLSSNKGNPLFTHKSLNELDK